MTDEKATPRVIKRGQTAGEVVTNLVGDSEVFATTLISGRNVVLRAMTAGDLLFLEKTLGGVGDMERSLKLAARLSTSEGRISYEDLQKLSMRDLKSITKLLEKAGDAEDDEDEFPND